MVTTITILSGAAFISGIFGYWALSKPLKDLPTLNEILAAKDLAKKHIGDN